jgi:hypothetical protein
MVIGARWCTLAIDRMPAAPTCAARQGTLAEQAGSTGQGGWQAANH